MGARLAAFRDPLTLTISALAVHRLTRLITDDEITRPLRDRLSGIDPTRPDTEPGRLAYFLSCRYCVGLWVAAGWAAATATAPAATTTVGAALAWSSVAGLLSSVE
jgi:Protein of unknown function (DUF1360)